MMEYKNIIKKCCGPDRNRKIINRVWREETIADEQIDKRLSNFAYYLFS